MATSTKNKVQASVEAAPPTEKTAVNQSVYTAEELANHHKAFGTYREIVVVALRQAKMKTATFAEAKKIVDKFKNKEVK